MNIEDNIVPDTVNELALVQRIRELKAEFYRAGKMPSYHEPDPLTLTVDPYRNDIRVPLAVGADAYEDTKQYRYIIRAQVHGGYDDGKGVAFGHRTFIDKGTLAGLDKYGIMRYLDEVRKDTNHQFAKFLTEGK